jgi:hypothetical protein
LHHLFIADSYGSLLDLLLYIIHWVCQILLFWKVL